MYYRVSKRILDVSVATLVLILLSPLMLALAIMIKFTSSGPVFFRQERIGQWGVPFFVYKFRTMRPASAGSLITAAGDSRVTPLGRWLRSSKMDELPQLLNVLRGEMSLVGPRPQFRRYVQLYDEQQRRVLSVRPGLTGYYQVSFPHYEEVLATQVDPESFYITTFLPEKLALELNHVSKPYLTEDLRLMVQTMLILWPRGKRPDVCGAGNRGQRAEEGPSQRARAA